MFTLDSYLPPTSLKQLYITSVVDELDDPIKDAYVVIRREIDGSYANISNFYTNGYGQGSVYLISDVPYKFVISLTGYETEYSDWTPSTSETGHVFQLVREEVPINASDWRDSILFNGYVDGGIVYVNYTDSLTETINVTIQIQYFSNNTYITAYWYNSTSSSFQHNQAINTSYHWRILLYCNHTTFGYIVASFHIEPRNQSLATADRLEAMFTTIFGENNLGWINFIAFFVLIGCLFAFGEYGAGLSLMGTGFVFLFLNVLIIGFIATTLIPILFIVLGIMVEWINVRRVRS